MYLKANFELSLLCYFFVETFCLCYFFKLFTTLPRGPKKKIFSRVVGNDIRMPFWSKASIMTSLVVNYLLASVDNIQWR